MDNCCPSDGCHNHNNGKEKHLIFYFIRLFVSLLLLIVFNIIKVAEPYNILIFVLAYLIASYDVLLRHSKIFSRGNCLTKIFC